MSGRWLSAANKFAGYQRHRGQRGDGRASDMLTRSVLRELCWIAHDSGVVQVGVERLAERLAVTPRAIKLALQRLREEGWIVQAVRGTGNRHGIQPRESVYVIRPLPDANGEEFPSRDWLDLQWINYLTSRRWMRLSNRNREAVREAYFTLPDGGLLDERQGRPSPLLGERRSSTRGTPIPHIHTSTYTTRDRPALASEEGEHYRVAERTRATFKIATTEDHDLADPDPCPHDDPRGPRYCALCRAQASAPRPAVVPCPHEDPRGEAHCALCRRLTGDFQLIRRRR